MLIRQPISTSVLIRHSPWLRRFLRDLAWEVLEKHKLRSCFTQYLHFNAWLNASIFIWINQEKEKHTLADAAVYSHCPALLQKAVFLSQSCTTVRVSWHIQARLYTITHICKQIHTYLLCYPKKMQWVCCWPLKRFMNIKVQNAYGRNLRILIILPPYIQVLDAWITSNWWQV